MKALTLLLFFVASIAASADTNRKEGDYSIIVSAEIQGEAIAVSIDSPQMPEWISYPPDFHFENLTSATIEGDNISIPLQSGDRFAMGGGKIRILLPRSAIKGAKLRLITQGRGSRDIVLDSLVSYPSYTYFPYWILIAGCSILLTTFVVYRWMKKQNKSCDATGDNVPC